jgi:hypothetical protein
MTAADITDTRGAEMFARYAYAPNQLGYCGPPDSTGLLNGTRHDIERAAQQFTGVWPYLQVLSRMTGIADPLDHRLVESYWLGGGLGAKLNPYAFTDALLAVIGPQAGHYWSHLGSQIANEAAANHCFHVFGVYPWSRLLNRGMDHHPLSVLESCRISWGTVLSTDTVTAIVSCRTLRWDGRALSLSPESTKRVDVEDGVAPVSEGDLVAVHWGRICDRLTPEKVARLKDSTDHQLLVTNRRLRAQT